jgi:hypothetical protein
MTNLKRHASAILMIGGLLAAPATAFADPHCHVIRGKGVGQDSGTGTTTANVIGGGVLHGTTTASFSITGGSFPVFEISGSLSFSAQLGTVTTTVSGTFDVSTGDFAVTAVVTSGTDRFSDVTGSIAVSGTEDMATGQFAEDFNGQICHTGADQ